MQTMKSHISAAIVENKNRKRYLPWQGHTTGNTNVNAVHMSRWKYIHIWLPRGWIFPFPSFSNPKNAYPRVWFSSWGELDLLEYGMIYHILHEGLDNGGWWFHLQGIFNKHICCSQLALPVGLACFIFLTLFFSRETRLNEDEWHPESLSLSVSSIWLSLSFLFASCSWSSLSSSLSSCFWTRARGLPHPSKHSIDFTCFLVLLLFFCLFCSCLFEIINSSGFLLLMK